MPSIQSDTDRRKDARDISSRTPGPGASPLAASLEAALPAPHFTPRGVLLPEYDLLDDSLLYFVHIPKTAGTSVYKYLDTVFLPQQVFPADRAVWHRDRLARMPAEAIDAFQCLRGHLYHAQLSRLFAGSRKRLLPMTVLRHPEQLLLSEYDMICHDTNVPMQREAAARGLTLDEFLVEPRFHGQFIDNPQLGAQLPRDRQSAHLLLQTELDPYRLPRDEWLDLLRAQLAGYAFVGIHERLEQSLQLLAYVFGWPCPAVTPHLNKARGTRHAPDAAQHELIRELHRVDFELYDWAVENFEARFAEMCARLEVAPEAGSATLRAAIDQHSAARRARRIERRAERGDYVEAVDAAGFHLGHVSHDWGRQIAWIGPEPRATVRLCLAQRGDRVLYLELLHHLLPEMINDLYVSVNGHPLQMTKQYEGQRTVCVGLIPERWLGAAGSVVEIVLGTSGVATPAALGLNPADDEVKCVALAALECFPTSHQALPPAG